jgi:hypothetical protein
MVIYGVDITGSLFVSGSSNFKGDINVSGSQIVSGSLNVLNSLLLNGQPFVGTQGPQGIQGSIGIQGTNGSNGAQGNQGPTGIQGTNGTVGTQGNQGPTGLQGTNGSQGNQGPTGLQGSTGSQGIQGAQGIQGTVGTQGATGVSAGITSYTNPADNRVLTSVNSTTINAESNLIFDGTNLGIGVTPSAWGSLTAFQINNAAIAGNNNADLYLTANAYYNSGWKYIQTTFANVYQMEDGIHSWFTAPSGTAGNAISFTQAMTLDASGNLLIGVTSNIGSTRRELVMRGGNGSVISLGNNTTADRFQIVSDSGENALLNNKANTPMIFYTNNTERMRITSAGNVGIGATVPSSKLHIDNALGADVISISDNAGSVRLALGQESSYTGNYIDSKNIDLKLKSALVGGSGGNIFFQTGTSAASTQVTINVSGNVGIGTTSPTRGLTINRSGGFASLNIVKGNTTNQIVYLGTGSSGADDLGLLQLSDGGTVRAQIYTGGNSYFNGGNVGIGTTTPGAKLHVVGDTYIQGTEYIFKTVNNTTGYLYFDHSGIQVWKQGVFNDNTSTFSIGNGGGFTRLLNITNAGNVGIGTISSTVNLLQKYLSITDNYNVGIILNDTRAPSAYELFMAGSAFYINYGTSNRFTITGTGNVGIGTISPTSNLSFDGSAAKTVGMERVTVSNTAGNNLTISASSATVGATDKNGGDVIISGGVATGTGSSRVVFRTATANFSTGTGDRTPSDKVIITGSGTIIQNGVASTFITGTCLANQTVSLGYTTVSGGRLRVHAIITPTDGTSIGAQKMSVIGNSTGGISEVVISNTTTATIGSWTFSGSGTFFGITKNAGSASTACTYLIEIIGNLA